MSLATDSAPSAEAPAEHGDPSDLSPMHVSQPRRRRRRQRPIDRIRVGLVLVATLVVATTFSALPIADDIRTTTIDFLTLGDPAEESVDVADVTEPVVEVQGEAIVAFDASVWFDQRIVGIAPPNSIDGLLTFRGSPTRSYYGSGPVPDDPVVLWRYPETGGLCRESIVGAEHRYWCGTGWTGQPTIFQRGDRLWTVFGAMDGAVHFLDATTGETVLPKFQTDDIIKGSVTIDPDGFPIVYTGSRDNFFRAIAFDGLEPRELWRLDANEVGPTLWNNDWDGSAIVLDDYLFVGGENSRIQIVRLNRSFAESGEVQVDPELVFSAPGWDDELLAAIGDENVSIENSVVISGDTLYFANSGGLVQGWDIGSLREGGTPERIFRFWVGDDVDASLVADQEGMLYVAAEFERNTERARELGQLLKLDPSKPAEEALVWAVEENQGIDTGIWSTPALHRGVVIFASQGGNLRAVDALTGESLWSIPLGLHLWQSPVVVDDVLLMGNCSGVLRAFDVSDPIVEPPELWALPIDEGCIESTPAIWNGSIVLGTRSGAVYGIGQAG